MRKIALAVSIVLVLAGITQAEAAFDAPVVRDGYTTELYGVLPAPTSGMAFNPVDGMMYVTVIDQTELSSAFTGERVPANVGGGGIYRLRPLPDGSTVPEPVSLGARVPLGLTFDPEPAADGSITLYFTDLDEGPLFAGGYGAVRAVDLAPDGTASAPRDVLVGLPIGVHQSNHLEWGPDGLLYVSSGSATDSGWSDEPSYPIGDDLPIELAQPAEQFPLSGSILRFDPDLADVDPVTGYSEVLYANRYRGNGFSEQPMDIVATGMRNNYGMAFVGDDLYVTLNGPNPMHFNDTVGDDLLLVVKDAPDAAYHLGTMVDFGWPGCLYATDASKEFDWPSARTPMRADKLTSLNFDVCEDHVNDHLDPIHRAAPGKVGPIASMGAHASADGLTVVPESWGPDLAGDLMVTRMSRGDVVQVQLDDDGEVAATTSGDPDMAVFAELPSAIDVIVHGDVMYVVRFSEGVLSGPASVWSITPNHLMVDSGLALSIDGPSDPDSLSVVVAGPGANSSGYNTTEVVMVRGTRLQFVTADIQEHNVVARAAGPDDNPWCDDASTGTGWADADPDGTPRCPAFASDTAVAGTFEVAGADALEPGTYDFFCTIHGRSMNGQLVVI